MKKLKSYCGIGWCGRVFFLTMVLSGTAQADDLNCNKEVSLDARVETTHREWPSEQQFTILELTLGKHTLQDVRLKLGETNLIPRSEYKREHHHGDKVCYISGRDGDGTIITFAASGTLSSFCLATRKNTSESRKLCANSVLVSKNLITGNGIKLGLTKDQVKQLLGTPAKEEPGFLVYSYKTKEKIPEKELPEIVKRWPGTNNDPYYHFVSFFVARFENNKLSSFQVSRSGSL